MSIFGKDHYIKFSIMMFSWQKMLSWISSSQQDNTENLDYIIMLHNWYNYIKGFCLFMFHTL